MSPKVAPRPTAAQPAGRSRAAAIERARDYINLTKPGITRLILITTGVGFYMAQRGGVDFTMLAHTLIGTALASSGTNALNQYAERDIDRLMRRTASRPLPAGRVTPRQAFWFAWTTALLGMAYLGLIVGWIPAALVLASLISYVYIYTPLKRRTSLATIVGAVPGALPILAGWAAGGGSLGLAGWTLFAIMFLWQLPHFLALAWIYREDYRRGGLVMLSVDDLDGRRTGRQIFNYALALVPVSLMPSVLGMTGGVYFVGAFVLGAAFLAAGAAVSLNRTERRARRLFFASVLYLPALLVLMVFDKLPA